MKFIDEILGKVDKAKTEDQEPQPSAQKTKAMLASAVIGGIAGLMIGASRKWNMLYSAAGGALIGGLIGNLFVPKVKTD